MKQLTFFFFSQNNEFQITLNSKILTASYWSSKYVEYSTKRRNDIISAILNIRANEPLVRITSMENRGVTGLHKSFKYSNKAFTKIP